MSGTRNPNLRTRVPWHALFWAIAFMAIALPGRSQTYIQENFSSATGTTPPAGWTTSSVGGLATSVWAFNNPGARTINAPASAPFAIFDSDLYCDDPTEAILESPTFSTVGAADLFITFDHLYRHLAGDSAIVEVFNGASWVRVAFYVASTTGATSGTVVPVSINASSLINVPNAKVRFRYKSGCSWYWAIDNIRVYSSPANDLAAVAIVGPNSACGLDAEFVEVQVRNTGINAITNFNLQLNVNGVAVANETVNAAINPGSTFNYTFSTFADLSAIGPYTIEVITELTGDGDPLNDTIRRQVYNIPIINTYPYVQNFESGTGGWEASGTNSTWAFGTPAKSVINSAASGVNAWVNGGLTGSYLNNDNSRVLSPCFDFSSLIAPEVQLNIWWNSEFSWDGAVLQSSIDNGATWQNVGAFGDPDNWYNDNTIGGNPGGQQQGWTGRNSTSNGSNGWRLAKHALDGLGGKPSVRLRIAFGSDASGVDNGFAFDDFVVQEGPAEKLKVLAVQAPPSSCALGSSESLSLRIVNQGSASFTSVPVRYSINGGTPVSESADFTADPLNPGDTQVYVFTTPANFSAVNQYNVVAYVDMPNENDRRDDTARVTVFKDRTISTFPNLETFDVAGHGWRSGGVNNSWALGTPAKTVINSANSAPNSWVTGRTANHNNNEQSWVLSPCYNLSSLVQPRVTMRVWWNSQAGFDGAVLQYSLDNGVTWVRVGASGDPNNWYNNAAITGNPGGQSQGWSGRASSGNGSGGWVTASSTIPALAGQPSVRFRVAFGSNATTTDNGFAFDDFQVDDAPPVELALRRILAPVSGCGRTAAEVVTVRVTNFGQAAQSNIPVSYRIGTGAVVTETLAGPIAPGDSATYSFTATADLSAPGIYNLTAYVDQAGDANRTNDTLRSTINALPLINSFPHTQDFESGQGGWVSGGTGSTWAFGTPAKSVINSAASGVNSWVTGGLTTGTYVANENSFVESPCYDLSTLTNPEVALRIWWNCEFSWDGAVLQSSINNGATWQNVGALGDPNNWYNDGTIEGNPGGQQVGWTGRNSSGNGSGGWVTAKNRLNGLAGQPNVRFRIAFGADGSVQDNGFAFDDFTVREVAANDIAVLSVDSLESDCPYTNAETVYISVANKGTAAQNNVPVSFRVGTGAVVTENIPTIAAGDTITYAFTATANFLVPGTYSIRAWSANPGDADLSNDTSAVVTFQHLFHDFAAGDYTQGFELNAGEDLDDWIIFNNNLDNITWNISTTTPRTGAQAVRYGTSTANNADDWIMSRCFDMEAGKQYEVSFWYRSGSATLPENMEVLLGTAQDPAGFTTQLLTLANFTNTSYQQAVQTFTVPANGIYYVGIHATSSANSSSLTIDDFRLREIFPEDFAVTVIDTPNTSCGLTAAERVVVRYTNFGGVAASNVPIVLSVNGTVVATETIAGPVASGASGIYTFTATADLATPNVYNIAVYSNLAADGLRTNDTARKQVINKPVISSFPYNENFENGQGFWTSGGTLSSWAFGTPAKSVINSAASGVNSWVTGGLTTGTYNANEKSFVESPCFDFSALTLPEVTLKIWWNSEFSWDGAVLQSTINNGATWQNVGALGDPNNWYNDGTISGAPGGQQVGWTGRNISGNGSGGWVTAKNSLVSLAGQPNVRFRIAFGADGSVHDDGFAFDDFSITQPDPVDVGITEVIPSIGTFCSGTNQDVSVVIRNFGTAAQSNIPLAVVITGTQTQTIPAVYPGPLAIGQTDTFLLSSFPIPAGTYVLQGYTTMPGDGNNLNDTTVTDTIRVFDAATITALANQAVCAGNAATLGYAPRTGIRLTWFDVVTGGTAIGSGDTLVTPVLTAPDTFYVQAANLSSATGGALNNAIGAGGFATFSGSYQTFTVTSPTRLVSFDVYPNGATSFTVALQTNTGTNITTRSYSVTGPGPINLNFGADIAPGSYRLTLSAISSGGLYRNTAGASYPYPVGSSTSITGNNFNAAYWYFFYNWKMEDVFCPSARVAIPVAVNQPPVFSLGADSTICAGASATFNAPTGAGFSYVWNDGSTGASLTANTSGIYWVDVTNNNGCVARDSIQLTVAPALVADAGADQGITCGGSLTLNASASGGTGTYDYRWLNGGPASAGYLITTAGTYVLEVTDDLGCVDVDTVVVSLTGSTLSVSLPATASTCFGSSVELAAVVTGGIAPFSYSWNGAAATADSTFDVANNGTVTVVVTDAAGCTISASTNVTVLPAPVANLGPDASLCIGDALSLDAGNAGATYVWSTGNVSQTISLSFSTAVVDSLITVRVINANGCEDTDSILVTVSAGPSVNLGADFSVCAGGTVNLDAGAGAASYLWSDGSTTQTVSFVATSTGVQSLSVVVTNAQGCETRDTIVYTVEGLPVVSLGNDTTICQGASLTLTAGSGGTFLWSDGSTGSSLIVTAAGTYSVIVTNAAGCQAADTIVVGVNSPAGITITVPSTIEVGEDFDASATGGTSYSWNFGADATPQTATGANPTDISYSTAGTKVVTVTVTAAGGCQFQLTDTIEVTTPTAINPNLLQSFSLYPNPNDGRFTVSFTLPNTEDVTIEVFEMTGKLVYTDRLTSVQQYSGYIQLEGLADGIYNLKITTSNGSFTQKLFIQ